MKSALLIFGVILAALSVVETAQADRPCKPIVEACISAGVIQPGVSEEVMLKKCVKPIISGRNIRGVQVDPSVMSACKAKVESRE